MSQSIAVTIQNLKSIPQRWGPSLVAIVGVAGVVAVLVAVLSIAKGFQQTLVARGSDNNVIVMRSGSSSELDSSLSGEQAKKLEDIEGIRVVDGRALVSPEVFVMVDLAKKGTDATSNVPMRGVTATAFQVHEDIEVVEGRMFDTGKRELIAGRGAAGQFTGVEVGQTLEFGQERWDVVGIFEADGSSAESELWADAPVVQGAFRRGNSYAVAYATLESPDQFQMFADTLENDPTISARVLREPEFLAEQSAALSGFINAVGYTIAILMALGALFGAINTMYTAVSDRSREIATLRAIGFSRFPIMVSVMVEAIALSLIGGVLGGGISYALFNGFTVSTLSFSSFTQVVFAFAVTPELLVQGIIIALFIGLIGGFFPAIRAARQPIPEALR